jgi:phosphoglycolate phosphatase-like HAD superfamily hydrolase
LSWQSEGLDDVIALFATGLRILLSMGSQQERSTEPKRSHDMGTEAPAVNGSDRYDVLVVEKYEDHAGAEKANWTRIGVAWPHKDGNGLNVELKAIPVSGKLVIRRHDAKARTNDA